ncbi:tail protein [Cupriavidus basilensis OR16]|uniref:Tail protein n=1 Tax=Cupriavidus basilensis OR16 TaxID=1127483 RepID=H1SDI2_9BURK|nr:putative phage tail protein [Cupriavidus basilensis]EHP39436.1 tail protein [Cupriavidus basilensis OR16]
MTHAELLSLLLPPVSYRYSPEGGRLTASIKADGNSLDKAMLDGVAVIDGITPYGRADLLVDWERIYGLADAARQRTIQERLAALLQRINEDGGLSREYFIFLALNLGFSINIAEFSPFKVGSAVGQPLYGDDWVFAWRINAPETTLVPFRVGRSAVGEPLMKWGNELLEAALKALAPAHTVLQFAYAGDPSLLIDEEGDGFLLDEDNDYLDFS